MSRKAISPSLKKEVWYRYNICWTSIAGECFSCRKTSIINANHFEVGHVLAVSRGGSNSLDNLRPICEECNKRCGSTNLFDWMITMDYRRPICLEESCINMAFSGYFCADHISMIKKDGHYIHDDKMSRKMEIDRDLKQKMYDAMMRKLSTIFIEDVKKLKYSNASTQTDEVIVENIGTNHVNDLVNNNVIEHDNFTEIPSEISNIGPIPSEISNKNNEKIVLEGKSYYFPEFFENFAAPNYYCWIDIPISRKNRVGHPKLMGKTYVCDYIIDSKKYLFKMGQKVI